MKKNGDLGRETIIRRTTLDDCKGEKFEELLAVFSTAVLRRVLASSEDGLSNPAVRISTAKGLRPDEYQLMVPLILAHRVSLGAMNERRARVRSTQEKFSDLLDDKKTELDRRAKENPQIDTGDLDLDKLSHDVKTNWLGSEEWANALLYGGRQSSCDAFLELPFSSAWKKANASSVEGLGADASQDILVDLESRLSRQRNRLRRWRDFSDSIRRTSKRASINPTDCSGLAFKDHQSLTVASISKAVRQSKGGSRLREDDQRLLDSMNEGLAHASGKPHDADSRRLPRARESEPVPKTGERSDTVPSPIPRSQDAPAPTESTSPIQAAASPEPDSQIQSPSVHISEPDNEQIPEPEPEPENQPNAYTLAERTRKSMSLIPPSSKRAHGNPQSRKSRPSFPVNQFETPRKQSAHYIEASAPAPAPAPGPSGRSTPRDELFDDDADYASVFKSRPRVAHSPVMSPAVHVSPLGEFDFDEEGSSYGSDDLRSSPLAARLG